MQTITKEYLLLFNAVTNAAQALQQLQQQLMIAQQQAEEVYLQEGELFPASQANPRYTCSLSENPVI